MPMYEFDCVDCHKTFEELVLAGQPDADIACPSCSSRHVSRRLSAFAVGASASSFGSGATSSDLSAGSSCATGSCCSGGNCW